MIVVKAKNFFVLYLENNDKKLSEFRIVNGTRLCCDDFLQTYKLVVTVVHR